MSAEYTLYKQIRSIENDLIYQSNKEWKNDVFHKERQCFNIIMTIKESKDETPFFDLKANWSLLKNHYFEIVLDNIKDWLAEVDVRYNGYDWNERRLQKGGMKT